MYCGYVLMRLTEKNCLKKQIRNGMGNRMVTLPMMSSGHVTNDVMDSERSRSWLQYA